MTDAPQVDAPPPAAAPEEQPASPAPEDIVRQEVENQPDDIPLDREYTKAQLDSAKAEIELLTPEQWIEISQYIHSLEDSAQLGEAPGIAWTTLYSAATGGQMNVTSRALTSRAAIEDMFDSVKYVMQWQSHMQWSPGKTFNKAPAATQQAPAATAAPAPIPSVAPTASEQEPVYVPVDGTNIEKFTVASVEHAISQNNNAYVKVKTVEGAFAKWGVNAWEEVVPVDFKAWPVGQAYQPPPEMMFCLVQTVKPKKVTSFLTE